MTIVSSTTPLYSIDSSSLIHAYRRAYPPTAFPSLWSERFPGLIADKKLVASKEVLLELKRKDDELTLWCRQYQDMFIEIDVGQQDQMVQIMGRYPRLVDTKKGKSGADPFVISLALTYSPPLTVVTEEGLGSEQNPRIPDVCRREGIRCSNVLDLIVEQGWQFT